jgi:ribosomal protein S18 acetylase RimI-like enzyme
MHIRPAVADDVDAIARFHVESWRHAYRDLAPAAVFEIMTVERRRELWSRLLASDATAFHHIVAEIDGNLVGIGGAGPATHPAYGGRGRISLLYIAPDRQRQGIGRRLMHDLAAWLQSAGHASAALSVVEGNTPAIAFYDTLGGRRVGTYQDPGSVWRSTNLVYAWDGIAALIEATRPLTRPASQ